MKVYTALVSPQRYALKPPRQLQPEVVHRLVLQLLCPALAEMKMNRCADQRVPNIVRKAVAVQKIRLLTLGDLPQSLVQFPQGFFSS